MRKILLDTSAYSELMRGNEKVANILNNAEIIYISIFVLAELYTGFKGGTKEKQNREILNRFLEKPAVTLINGTIETAEIFSEIKDKLKSAGTPIPINDIWIAANTIETGSALITGDKHFNLIPGLRIYEI